MSMDSSEKIYVGHILAVGLVMSARCIFQLFLLTMRTRLHYSLCYFAYFSAFF